VSGPLMASPFFATYAPVPTDATAESTYALLTAIALSTYCFDTGGDAVPDPGVARTALIVVGEVVPTSQYSVRTTVSS